MQQYAPDPIYQGIEQFMKLLLPSFDVRFLGMSTNSLKYPLVGYKGVSGSNRAYDSTNNVMRRTRKILLVIEMKEGEPEDWCKYKEFEYIKSQKELSEYLYGLIDTLVAMMVNPFYITQKGHAHDYHLAKLNIKHEGTSNVIPFRDLSPDKTMGVTATISFSYDYRPELCCAPTTLEQWQALSTQVVPDTATSRYIQKQIDNLSAPPPILQ